MTLSPQELRRAIHARPEPSFAEFETTELLAANISSAAAGTGALNIYRPLATGLVVEYSGAGPGAPYALLRADIDALRMDEDTACDYRSSNGFMHACGHDVHAAILYGFILEALGRRANKNFIFVFQPAEETGGGAKHIIDSGVLDKFNISSACALHVSDEYEEGVIASTDGVLFASAREVDVEFYGKASHIAFPEKGRNALAAARSFLEAADGLVKKAGDGLIFGVGKFFAGEVRNILPARARLEGSVRALSARASDDFYEGLRRALDAVKTFAGVDYTLATGSYYPEVRVDPAYFGEAFSKLSAGHNFIKCAHKMTGEDFGFFSARYPSFMFWLGCGVAGTEPAGLHNPRFFPPESVVGRGINILKELLLD